MLINLPATDLVTFVGVSALLIAIALVACYVPCGWVGNSALKNRMGAGIVFLDFDFFYRKC